MFPMRLPDRFEINFANIKWKLKQSYSRWFIEPIEQFHSIYLKQMLAEWWHVQNIGESFCFSFDLPNWWELAKYRFTPWHLSKNWFLVLYCIAGVIANHFIYHIREFNEKIAYFEIHKLSKKKKNRKANKKIQIDLVSFAIHSDFGSHLFIQFKYRNSQQLKRFNNTHTQRAINTRAYNLYIIIIIVNVILHVVIHIIKILYYFLGITFGCSA